MSGGNKRTLNRALYGNAMFSDFPMDLNDFMNLSTFFDGAEGICDRKIDPLVNKS